MLSLKPPALVNFISDVPGFVASVALVADSAGFVAGACVAFVASAGFVVDACVAFAADSVSFCAGACVDGSAAGLLGFSEEPSVT